VIGRALDPAELGIFYIVLGINSFVSLIIDWGQGTYLVREMARGRNDEPELIGSALVFRLATTVFSSVVAVVIALTLGYKGQVVELTLLAIAAAIPSTTLFVPFDCCFRARDRMDVDASATVTSKAATLVATAVALRFGGGLTEVILMQAVGGIAILLFGIVAAQRLDIAVKAPAMKPLRELFVHGAPIMASALVIALQPFLEILLLSRLVGPTVVGWYGAFRGIYNVVVSPAMLLLGASFPELSRVSLSLPDLRRVIDKTGRVLFVAAAFTCSALYVFAGDMVAILYGHGRLEQSASILRMSSIFIPLMFFSFLLASTLFAAGRNKPVVVISIVRVAIFVILGFLLIEYWQNRFGNGAIALVIIAGLVEIPAMIAYFAFLPKGTVGSTTTLNCVRAYIASLCTAVPLVMLQPLSLWYLAPLFGLLFPVAAVITRLILPSDLRLAMEIARTRVLAFQATTSAPDR
jgi:O-antigen/teichoic acid export membrane protein